LQKAAEEGHDELVALLLKSGASVEEKGGTFGHGPRAVPATLCREGRSND
jgi:ankyrin repeat protein